jgi:hypothetical protein
MVISGDHNAGRKYSITLGNSYCEILGDFEILWINLTNRNCN